jgi:hypothetical protein
MPEKIVSSQTKESTMRDRVVVVVWEEMLDVSAVEG